MAGTCTLHATWPCAADAPNSNWNPIGAQRRSRHDEFASTPAQIWQGRSCPPATPPSHQLQLGTHPRPEVGRATTRSLHLWLGPYGLCAPLVSYGFPRSFHERLTVVFVVDADVGNLQPQIAVGFCDPLVVWPVAIPFAIAVAALGLCLKFSSCLSSIILIGRRPFPCIIK